MRGFWEFVVIVFIMIFFWWGCTSGLFFSYGRFVAWWVRRLAGDC